MILVKNCIFLVLDLCLETKTAVESCDVVAVKYVDEKGVTTKRRRNKQVVQELVYSDRSREVDDGDQRLEFGQ